MSESDKLIRDLWKQAEEQRRLLQEATHAIVALTRALQACGMDALAVAPCSVLLASRRQAPLQLVEEIFEHQDVRRPLFAARVVGSTRLADGSHCGLKRARQTQTISAAVSVKAS